MILKTSREQTDLTLSVFLSLLGGIFIILGGVGLYATIFWHSTMLIIGGPWIMLSAPYPFLFTIFMATITSSSGLIVLFSSYKIHKQPESGYWEVFVILGSLIALYYAGSWGLGGILGLIGGATVLGERFRNKMIANSIRMKSSSLTIN